MEHFIATNHFYLRSWKKNIINRLHSGYIDVGNWHPFGVVALGIPKQNPNEISASVSVCSPKDQFTKKLGRHIAYQRLLNPKLTIKLDSERTSTISLRDILNSYGEYGCWNSFKRYKIIHPKTHEILSIQIERLIKEAVNTMV